MKLGNLMGRLRPTRRPELARSQVDDGGIYDGTVGWEDGKSHYDVDDQQVPFVKVRLFLGHNPVTEGENLNPSRAAGRKIMARIDPKSSDIPEDGETVIVVVPKGRSNVPGAAMIIGRPNPDPKWIPNRVPGEKMIFGPGDSFIRFKADGTIFLFTKKGDGDSGKPVQVELSPDGFRVNHPHGEAYCDVDGFGMSHSSGAAFSGGAIAGLPAPLDAFSSYIKARAAIIRLNAQALVLGPQGGQDNLMRATPTLSTLDTLQGEIVALQAAVHAANALAAAATPGPTSGAAATVATAALRYPRHHRDRGRDNARGLPHVRPHTVLHGRLAERIGRLSTGKRQCLGARPGT